MSKITKSQLDKRPLRIIANEIKVDWYNAPESMIKYIDAMSKIDKLGDQHKDDSGYYIVSKFMAGSLHWRGEVAGRIKQELMYYED